MGKIKRSLFSILLVDDTPELLDIHSKMLRKAGYEVQTAVDGSGCRDALNRSKPDILLLDVRLPDINGKDLCCEIKKNQGFSSIYLILISSFDTSDKEILAGLDCGADTYITRPIKDREFLLRVDASCRTILAERDLRKSLKLWESTFHGIKDAIFVIDSDCNIVKINQTTIEFLKKEESEIIGHKCYNVVHGSHENIDNCPFLKSKISNSREFLNFHANEKWYECDINPIFDETGKMISAIHTMKDITERKLDEMAMVQKSIDLERFNSLMLGREIKMVELKKEINELLKNAGEKEKYNIHD